MNGLYIVVRAQARYAPNYPEATFDNLRHLLEASLADDACGVRKAQMLEHLIVNQADTASAAANVYAAAFIRGQSFGIAPDRKIGKDLNFRYEL